MRHTLLIFALVSGTLWPLNGQAREEPLALSIKIVDQKACAGDNEVYIEVLDFEERFTNESSHSVVFFEGSAVTVRVLVGASLDDLEEGKYETENEFEILYDDNGMIIGQSKEHRIVVQSSESVESEDSVGIPVRMLGVDALKGTVAWGTHYVQIEMVAKIADSPSSRKKQPYRQVKVLSKPVLITIPSHAQISDCAAGRR